jgi:hypothetical protein
MLKYTTFTHLPNTFQHPQYVPFLVAELTDFLHFSQYLTKYPCVTMSCNNFLLQLLFISHWTHVWCHCCQRICCNCLVTKSTWQFFISCYSVISLTFQCILCYRLLTLSFAASKKCLVYYYYVKSFLFWHSRVTCGCLKRNHARTNPPKKAG